MPVLPKRIDIQPGLRVQVVEKHNQRTGLLSEGIVSRILTNSPSHPHGIKVMLTDGRVGRVQAIFPHGNGIIGNVLPIKSEDSENK